jgi:SAM-dependent methyltransferase
MYRWTRPGVATASAAAFPPTLSPQTYARSVQARRPQCTSHAAQLTALRQVDLEASRLFPSHAGPFDVVSCQFALHYAFASEAAARCLLHNVVARLRPGGVFCGTLPNANHLV